MKKILSIQIKNYRAFYGEYSPIQIPNGENLLIYGENGSGKSSLFKGFNNYFRSSRDNKVTFVKNIYSSDKDGYIKIGFGDFENNSRILNLDSFKEFIFSSGQSNNTELFIQDAALVKGFLDYRDLLDVYFHREPIPNLFELVVISLLGENVPLKSGGNYKFGDKWRELQNDLTSAYTRNVLIHRWALYELPRFETHLRNTLDEVFILMNNLLSRYFHGLGIELSYKLKKLQFNYGPKSNWHTTADLRLNIIKDKLPVVGDYSDVLNEARLSAFAICLYLAAVKQNPADIELKTLFLDDIFIGLDSGNRLPILNIINNEFKSYQIFLATYDRHTYELAKEHFRVCAPNKWLPIEFYVGKEETGNTIFDKPIVIKGDTNFEKAIQYLHDRTKPDYPAAANYFRKALEKLILDNIPKWELTDNEFVQIRDHKLSLLMSIAVQFIKKTGNTTEYITQIESLLHALLHPLSHNSFGSPVYKGELLIIEENFRKLEDLFNEMNIPNSYKCILGDRQILKFKYKIDLERDSHFYYEIKLESPLVLKKFKSNELWILASSCQAEKCSEVRNNKNKEFNLSKKNPDFHYKSIENAYYTIYNYLNSNCKLVLTEDYLDSIEYNNGEQWLPIKSIIVW